MEKIIINLNELVDKELAGTIKNHDFTQTWTNVVLLPIYRIEYLINSSKHSVSGYNLDQAFYYGQLIRIRAFLLWERRLVCAHLLNRELASIFCRILLEDNITLQFYLLHPEKLDDYRKSAFKAESEFENQILKNREERTEPDQLKSDWEDGLLNSIRRAYATVGLTSEQIHNSRIPQSPQIREMAKEVNLETMYTAYRMECHSTHGDWFDISRYFLEEKDGLFFPRFTEDSVDIRLLNPILQIVYKTLFEFLDLVEGHGVDMNGDLNEDNMIITTLDMMHLNFLNHRPLTMDIETISN